MKDLAQTLWIAFDKKQPDYPELIDWIGMNISTVNIYAELVSNFNTHLQKIVTIKMLVAMKDGEVLEELSIVSFIHKSEMQDYQKAMESVLYEGWQFDHREFNDYYENSLTGKRIYYSEYWKGFAQWGEGAPRVPMKISDMTGEPITLNWWKEALK